MVVDTRDGINPARSFTLNRKSFVELSPVLRAEFTAKPGLTEINFLGEPAAFNRLLLWVKRGAVMMDGETRITAYELMAIWMIAHHLQIPRLQNHTMELLLDPKTVDRGGSDLLISYDYIYHCTPVGSPMRRLLVFWALKGERFRNPWAYEDLPREMLIDLLEKIGTDASPGTQIGFGKREDYFLEESSSDNPTIS